MKVTVRTTDRTFSLEVDSDELVENLKAILEVETNVPLLQQQIWFKGQELPHHMKLSAAGIRDDSMLTLLQSTNSSADGPVVGGHWSIRADGSAANPAELHKHLRGDPVAMAQLQQRNPNLAHSVLENDIETFQRLLREQHQRKLILEHQDREDAQGRPTKRQHQESQEPTAYSQSDDYRPASQPNSFSQPANNLLPEFANHDLLFNDPFDVDAQRRIEEAIRQLVRIVNYRTDWEVSTRLTGLERNVDDNWEAAIEHNPESFARVIMLYVDMEVNGLPLKAFVDSGAQSTIISMECAERCGLLRLLDRRYVGIAKGVGQSLIAGRIHVAPLKIGNNYYPCSFTVLEHADVEFIFGLDMLRKHQCTIDLKENVLWIGGGEHAVPFLQEKDLPQHLHAEAGIEDAPPSTEGITSGPGLAVHPPAPVHAPLVQGRQSTTTGPSRNGRRTSRSPQGDRDNAKVQRLVDLGFDKKQVLDALSLFHGNEDQAASYLFGS